MTSAEKIAANRNNARKSTGPRTAAGKKRVSANALRHGLATIARNSAAGSAQIELIAKVICGDAATPAQYEQALIIAESEVVLMHVRAVRVAVIEGARRIAPVPGALIPGFPTDHEWTQAIDDLARGRPRGTTKLLNRGANAVRAFTAKIATSNHVDEGKTERADGGQRQPESQNNVNMSAPPAHPAATAARNEVEVLRQALPELIRLDRYAQRALSRRQRAIRNLVAITIVGPRVLSNMSTL
jgi:hypothetical protein